ncbi:transposase [Desulfallas thermosapovorans]|uniref:Transposase n=1 Tax=Desulfallas thermosapovorans DSM 6562 TaxID=1121431 RepID=A0A5S4ZPS7_9FIRM|nr:transposase [Desulfallas thermosapovorans]TYO92762.1 transposase [Desulfallas thermosapovorans DSM 6562]
MTRKQYPPEIKMQIVKEAMETGNASIVARRHSIAASLVARWVRCYKRAFKPGRYILQPAGCGGGAGSVVLPGFHCRHAGALLQ